MELLFYGALAAGIYWWWNHSPSAVRKKLRRELKRHNDDKARGALEKVQGWRRAKSGSTDEQLRWLARNADTPEARRYFQAMLKLQELRASQPDMTLGELRALRDEFAWARAYGQREGMHDVFPVEGLEEKIAEMEAEEHAAAASVREQARSAQKAATAAQMSVFALKENLATIEDSARLLRGEDGDREHLTIISEQLRGLLDHFPGGLAGDEDASVVLEYLAERMSSLSIDDAIISRRLNKLRRGQS